MLPRQAVGQLIAGSGRENGTGATSEDDTGVLDDGANRAKTEAVRTIVGRRRGHGGGRREMREPQIVHEARRQDAGEGRQPLLCLVGPCGPARRQALWPEVGERAVAIVGVARECGVIAVQPYIPAQADLIAGIGCLKDAAERRKPPEWLDRHHPDLVGSLEACEEECAIPSQRAAGVGAELAAFERRIRVARVTRQARVRREAMIPIEIESAALEGVGSRSRHDVDGAVAGEARWPGSKLTVAI